MARSIKFGEYDTAANGLWTLASWTLSEPEYQSNLVSVPGRDGPLDLSTALTGGEPRYNGRTLTATLESSEGTRAARETRIGTMINALDGYRMNIYLPDDSTHYLTGRVRVVRQYNDLAHAAVQVTAVCDPWLYSTTERTIALTAGETEQTATLPNAGRRTVVPLVTITGDDASVLLAIGSNSWSLGAGAYQLPALRVPAGGASLTYSGSGSVSIKYREAVLR